MTRVWRGGSINGTRRAGSGSGSALSPAVPTAQGSHISRLLGRGEERVAGLGQGDFELSQGGDGLAELLPEGAVAMRERSVVGQGFPIDRKMAFDLLPGTLDVTWFPGGGEAPDPPSAVPPIGPLLLARDASSAEQVAERQPVPVPAVAEQACIVEPAGGFHGGDLFAPLPLEAFLQVKVDGKDVGHGGL